MKGEYPFYSSQALITRSPQALGGTTNQLTVMSLNYLLDTPENCDIYKARDSDPFPVWLDFLSFFLLWGFLYSISS